MLIFGAYEGQRLPLDVPVGRTVQELKVMIQEKLGISVDIYSRDNKILVLSYAGAQLGDTWVFSDLGIVPGTTVKIQLRENVQPVLYIRCSHNQETLNVFDSSNITNMKLDKVRSVASMMSGLPVGIFRLTTADGKEMFDSHCLENYQVGVGDTILLEVWDGWNEFLNLSIMGFTSQVTEQVSGEDVVGRYQLKVAMFIAAHFGHVDLARYALRQGIRSDEPTGYHPARAWCKDNGHIDSLKCPVHEATLCGQVGVLRLFVNHEISCLKAKDANGLEPLNIALRRQIKNCASYILSKQWTKVNINKTFTLHIGTYARLRQWCDRAKERALVKFGPSKSSLRRRNFNSGPLLSHGIIVDGYSASQMTGKSKTELLKEEKDNAFKESSRERFSISVAEILGSTQEPESYFRTVLAAQGTKVRQRARQNPLRWQKSSISSKLSKEDGFVREIGRTKSSMRMRSQCGSSTFDSSKFRTPSTFTEEESEIADYYAARLPPIMQSSSMRRTSKFTKDTNTAEPNVRTGSVLNTKLKDNESREIHEIGNHKKDLSLLVNRASVSSRNVHSVQENAQKSSTNQLNPSHEITNLKTSLNIVTNNTLGKGTLKIKSHPSTIEESVSSNADEVFTIERKHEKVQKRKTISTSYPSLGMKTTIGSITLPLVSHEQDRRPFFYHHGVRENELVESIYKYVTKYKGNSNRERAVNSLNLANSFSEKPWLSRVRLALNVTSNSIKRNVRLST